MKVTGTFSLAPGVTRGLAMNFSFGTLGTGKVFALGNVQVEKGSQVTPFEFRPYGTELALCQRYYEMQVVVHSNSPSTQYQSAGWRQVKRGTTTLVTTQYSGTGVGAIAVDPAGGVYGIYQTGAPTGVGTATVTGSAEL